MEYHHLHQISHIINQVLLYISVSLKKEETSCWYIEYWWVYGFKNKDAMVQASIINMRILNNTRMVTIIITMLVTITITRLVTTMVTIMVTIIMSIRIIITRTITRTKIYQALQHKCSFNCRIISNSSYHHAVNTTPSWKSKKDNGTKQHRLFLMPGTLMNTTVASM